MITLRKLKREYDKALKQNKESFFIEERELVTTYAKYLIQYLESVKVELDKKIEVR